MALITILGTDKVSSSRADINSNFLYLQGLIGGGSLSGSGTLDFPSLPRGEATVLTMAAVGAIAGHACFVGAPSNWDNNVSFNARISANDVITVVAVNNKADGTEVNPASGTWTWVAF